MSVESFYDQARRLVVNLLEEMPRADREQLIDACAQALTQLYAAESRRMLTAVIEDARTSLDAHLSPGSPQAPSTQPRPDGQAKPQESKPGIESESFTPPGENLSAEEQDQLLPQAVALVQQHQRASVSLLQRRLRIGYSKAAQLIELLKQQGVVGPAEGERSHEAPRDERDKC